MDGQQSVPSGGFNPSQYDFITNPTKPKKSGGFLSGGNGIQKYLFLIIGIVVVLIIIIGIFSVFSGGSSNREQLISLAKSQNSLIALVENGQKNSSDSRLTNISTSLLTIITTDRVSAVGKIDGKVKDSEIQGGLGDLEKSLEEAKINGTFDDTYTAALEQSLADYQKRIKEVFDSTSSASTKEILQTSSTNAKLMSDLLKN